MTRLSTHVLAVALVLAAATAVGHADVSKKVQGTMKGQILISPSPLPEQAEDDATTLKALKKAAVPELGHTKVEGVPTWRFHFMAFMNKKAGADMVALDFYLDDKTRTLAAEKRLAGIDPNLMLLQAQVELSDDDGLTAGKSYVVKLTSVVKGKEVVLATTKLRTK